MAVLERIKEYIDFKGDTVQKLEKKAGMSNGSFASQLKKGKTIGVDKLENILTAYQELNPQWVMTGVGEMELSQNFTLNDRSVLQLNNERFVRKENNQLVPLFNITGSAGIDTVFQDKGVKNVPIDYLKIPNMPKCDGAIFMVGDSMYPVLKAGDILAYKEIKSKDNITWGEMYAIAINHQGDEMLLFKYLQKSEKKNWVKLVSANTHHQDKEYPMKSITGIAHINAAVRFFSAL